MKKLKQNFFSNLTFFLNKQKKWKKYFYIIFTTIIIIFIFWIILIEKEINLNRKNNQKIQQIEQKITEINKKYKNYYKKNINKEYENLNTKNILMIIIKLAKKNNVTFLELKPIKYKIHDFLLHTSIKATTQCQFLDCLNFLSECSKFPLTIINELQLIHNINNKDNLLTLNFIITAYSTKN